MALAWLAATLLTVLLIELPEAALGVRPNGAAAHSARPSGYNCDAYCTKAPPGRGYVGQLDTDRQLAAALAAASYRQEVILIYDSRADHLAQAVSRWQSFGYWHVLALTGAEATCRHVGTVLDAPIVCGWYSHALAQRLRWAQTGASVWWKFITVVRAVRLGQYNVLALDTDTTPLHRLYDVLKSPPLGKAHLLAAREQQWGFEVNNAVVYVQNASASGPAVHALYMAMMTAVRW